MLVLTWNLFHGRSVPDTPRELLADFAAALAGWEWDVALLQEVPPWWPPALGRACGASARTALTSRNWLLALSRPAARRRPDLVKSWGGGANAILVRGDRVAEHRLRTLRAWPERRVVHGVRLERGWWVCNVHAQADIAKAVSWAFPPTQHAPSILGGDMNTHRPVAPGFVHAAGHDVDHVLVRGLEVAAPGRTLDRGDLSDHAPLMLEAV